MSERLIYVMGPSGVGKDSLLGYARGRVADDGVVFAHRYITRPEGGGENHVALTDAEFDARSRCGLFALQWRSHMLRYGIGIEIDPWLALGCTVVVNGSRAYVGDALARYPRMTVVHVTAPPHVLAARLAARARETRDEIAARLARSAPFVLPDGASLVTVENGGKLDDAGGAFVDVVRRIARG
ncbi:phosphonate metabolism protein/1,5-bisphosphokinase (PRPP-forming) PhnN [Paraburkholderia caballeronis]|uniref:Ribose 1,5-bisphosphate phosphokinase PhnN n=1 Tax=Paraburkholderia caballeronis TaxID=416943 RepID=A0A1H7QKL3_9BURK|nr:phosphonate metabolism protein/1,5-bisphosphokinase (PRPP-forming) PhnN [Paraburkholderia caballeronis]PXW22504.1 ribose 1,5-bisphosphokinase [Paraburkholderia caballeronis]PXW96375.1 ribose 1,5-bisphosphokinase [Paraburkholderia caballeronis]RAJ92786.1 ribose 1,5-bisphosphokinase [Paraburkholderia caballeronis]TDV15054.1 ribose 1,5-bisphosphokinase [Paraburkholderia caballeronis]TDV16821.1 ribose 1,5-bisphosphokinase [Paraburkholderia caballeronis]